MVKETFLHNFYRFQKLQKQKFCKIKRKMLQGCVIFLIMALIVGFD